MVRIGIFICMVILLTAGQLWCADVKDQLQGIKREIRQKKLLLKKTTKVETKVSDELVHIDKNLRDKEAGIALLLQNMRGVETTLDRTGKEILAVRDDAERKKQQIGQRLSALYKAGEMGGVRVYFSSESFPQMTENLRYMKAVLDNDKRLFAEYNARIERLRYLKASLERDVDRKQKIKSTIEVKKQEIEEEKKKKAAYLQEVRENKKTYQVSIKELEANARRLQTMVEKLEARSRKRYTVPRGHKYMIGGGSALPPLSDKGFGAQRGRLAMPTRGEVIDGFGRHKHPEFNSFTVSNGISIAAPLGADVRAVYDGRVIFADYFKGYGNMIIIDHGGGFFTLYAHAGKIMKRTGANVVRNEVIASVGDVDSSRGPMLYFEIRYQGKPVDPAQWFR